jgi:hypothetical protein
LRAFESATMEVPSVAPRFQCVFHPPTGEVSRRSSNRPRRGWGLLGAESRVVGSGRLGSGQPIGAFDNPRPCPPPNAHCVPPKRNVSRQNLRRDERATGAARGATAPAPGGVTDTTAPHARDDAGGHMAMIRRLGDNGVGKSGLLESSAPPPPQTKRESQPTQLPTRPTMPWRPTMPCQAMAARAPLTLETTLGGHTATIHRSGGMVWAKAAY